MGFFQELRAFRRFSKLPECERNIVFYSEGPAYWGHLRPIVECLANERNQRLTYVTSDPADPGYAERRPNVNAFCIGTGLFRTMWFQLLQAKILVLTLPDLENSHLKRSKYPVHYAYVFHSIVSTHMIYRTAAFDHYDTILCVGPHHEREIRETERLYGLESKELVPHGYGRLDEILAERSGASERPNREVAGSIVIAPSWGPEGLIESGKAAPLVATFLDGGFEVMLRPHPETLKRSRARYTQIVDTHRGNPNFHHEQDVDSKSSLMASDLMVSDWSGAALEYAFGLGKPVMFVNVPRKVNNPEYERYETPPLEETVRTEIGAILSTDDMSNAAELARELISTKDSESLVSLAERHVYNLGKSGSVAADWLIERSKSI